MNTSYKNGLYFVPLGGSDNIGMNMYAYACHGKWIVVDAGYGFLSDEYPSMDMCYASPQFLQEFKDDIEGLFITHAHEDHLGAIAQIWPALGCPVYATAFATRLMQARMEEYHLKDAADFHIIKSGDTITTDAFCVKFIALTHSVPETCGLLIKTDEATIFHATDWRFDDGKLSSLTSTDFDALKQAGQEGVDMFVCDSTNILVPAKQPSEYDIRANLLKLIPTIEGGLVATCFASNLMRLESLILAADAANRTPVIMGRSIETNIKLAKECGYFKDLPAVYTPEKVPGLTSDKALYICTGSQADYRSALSVIAKGESKYVKLDSDSTVIFSSKTIPGNEDKIEQMQEKMVEDGATLITAETDSVHTSGHASKEELKEMYEILKPKIVFPVHGDKRFIREHKRFAISCGVPEVASARTGELFCLKQGKIEKIQDVPTDVIGVDHGRSVPFSSELIKIRKRMAFNGSLFISAFVSADRQLLDVQMTSLDILQPEDWVVLSEQIKKDVFETIARDIAQQGLTDNVKDLIRGRIRRAVFKATDMKPVTVLHIFQQGEN